MHVIIHHKYKHTHTQCGQFNRLVITIIDTKNIISCTTDTPLNGYSLLVAVRNYFVFLSILTGGRETRYSGSRHHIFKLMSTSSRGNNRVLCTLLLPFLHFTNQKCDIREQRENSHLSLSIGAPIFEYLVPVFFFLGQFILGCHEICSHARTQAHTHACKHTPTHTYTLTHTNNNKGPVPHH